VLILVRHGQTSANAGGLLQGRMDLPLDDEGCIQAMRTGAHIRQNFPHARVIASPLRRAVDTARAISDEIEIDERFIELDYGQWDGRAMSEVDPAQWAQWRVDPKFRPPGGESLVELEQRVTPALEQLRLEAQERDVVVVSHVSPIKCAVTWALEVDSHVTWRFHLDRASICRIAVTARGLSVLSMNEVAHLA
jgi:broad specificity phosphatase PhoE